MTRAATLADQRRYCRYPLERDVEYTSVENEGSDPWWRGKAKDFSFGGFRLLSNRRLHEGDCLKIRLSGDPGEEMLETAVCVVHVQAESPGKWLIGCQFLQGAGN
jgi:c-di-GMP-binding flagellar brake protein YcgR